MPILTASTTAVNRAKPPAPFGLSERQRFLLGLQLDLRAAHRQARHASAERAADVGRRLLELRAIVPLDASVIARLALGAEHARWARHYVAAADAELRASLACDLPERPGQ